MQQINNKCNLYTLVLSLLFSFFLVVIIVIVVILLDVVDFSQLSGVAQQSLLLLFFT